MQLLNGFGLGLTSVVCYLTLLSAFAVAGLAIYYYGRKDWIENVGILNQPLYQGLAFLLTLLFFPFNATLAVFILGFLIMSCLIHRGLNHYYHPIGSLMTAIRVAAPFAGYAWGLWYLTTLNLHWVSYVCIGLLMLFSLLLLPANFLTFIELNEVLFRRQLKRPYQSLEPALSDACPRVCIHVPTYSEPPEIVISTLNCLANLNYPNFEVILMDNNTQDEALWQPVKKHCESLGERFRFIHVDNMKGAKAGALNYALEQTSKDCELIAVVDADYHARPDFLARLTGYFADPTIGFVQTPHDYRNWEHSLYLRMCYWEYRPFHWSGMAALNERDAGITIGTMCIIRRAALEQAGGWATWCVTEDSELAVRIHALGYKSHYVMESFGQGLIPENFTDYRKQRFRWTAGPIQEFRHHFNMLISTSEGSPAKMSWLARLHHLNHGPQQAHGNEMMFFLPIIGVLILSMLATRPTLYLPPILWLLIPLTMATQIVYQIMLANITMRCTIKDMLLSSVASNALRYIRAVGVLKAAFGRTIPWLRTNKFKTRSSVVNALLGVKGELVFALVNLVFMLLSIMLMPWHGLYILFIIGSVLGFVTSLAAPFMAVLAAKTLNCHEGNQQKSETMFAKAI